jgi:selT/selW/selH-like putative selenoprotein
MESNTGKGVQVEVEYCSGWGYGDLYEKLRKDILAAFPNADVIGQTGRTTSFEVKINGREAFSKLKSGSFPDFGSVVKAVERASRGLEPETIKPASGSCVISWDVPTLE